MPLPKKPTAKQPPSAVRKTPGGPKKRPAPQRQAPPRSAAKGRQPAPSGAPIENEQIAPPQAQQPPMAPPQAAAGGFDMPSMSAMDPAALAAGATAVPPQMPGAAPAGPAMPPGAAQAMATVQSGAMGAAEAKDQPRPEVPQATQAQITDWWAQTDNLSQRTNALWEAREANKTLFPARFDVNDPTRGHTPIELSTGRDKRRVRISRIYRDSLQTTALTVPEDIDFRWTPAPQASPPEQLGIPITEALDPINPLFAKTLTIVERSLLDEAKFTQKFQAWVQDASIYPISVLKYCFRREFSTTYLNSTPPDKDVSDSAALLEALVQEYALKGFDENDARFAKMLDLVKMLQNNAKLSRWFGVDLQIISMDSFGISEDARDLVDIYDAPFMFQDALLTGEQLLTRFPYNPTPDEAGNTFGIREDELANATPWDAENSTTDPNARGTTRGRANTQPRTVGLAAMNKRATSGDPKKQKYLVRELWSKKTRTVYTMLKGATNYLEVYIPQKTSERWYPFAILAPNRVPTEVYGISDLELKREIQNRINRKRTDEEKARWLSLDRLIYNTQALDAKEAVKLSDIQPGCAKGINLGSPSAKIGEAIMPFAYQFKPEAFDTSKDERDIDMMGALPVQALGQTGVANYAAEVEVAAQGAAAAVKQRQGFVKREIQGMLHSLAEILLQELTPEEARAIAGPYAFWPVVYDEVEAEKITEGIKAGIIQQVAPQVMAGVAQNAMNGMPIDVQSIQAQLEQLAAPLVTASIVNTYGSEEIVTRESIYRRLKVQVKSTLLSTLDRQSRIQSITLLAAAVAQMTEAAVASGTPFNPRGLLKKAAELLDETEDFDEMFPAISPLDLAAQQQAAAAGQGDPNGDGTGEPGGADGDEGGPTGNPHAQGAQAKQGTSTEKSRGATEGGGRPNPAAAAANAA